MATGSPARLLPDLHRFPSGLQSLEDRRDFVGRLFAGRTNGFQVFREGLHLPLLVVAVDRHDMPGERDFVFTLSVRGAGPTFHDSDEGPGCLFPELAWRQTLFAPPAQEGFDTPRRLGGFLPFSFSAVGNAA